MKTIIYSEREIAKLKRNFINFAKANSFKVKRSVFRENNHGTYISLYIEGIDTDKNPVIFYQDINIFNNEIIPESIAITY